MQKINRLEVWEKIIKNSGLFDEEFYLSTYQDVKNAGIDPIKHYVKSGSKENRNPNSSFNTKFYVTENPNVKYSNTNPLVHYIIQGRKRNLRINDGVLALKPNFPLEKTKALPSLEEGNFTHKKNQHYVTYNRDYIKRNKVKLKIESFSKNHLKGWMVSLKDKNAVFEFNLLINNIFFCKIKTNEHRKDLKRLKLSEGLGGIQLNLSEVISSGIFDSSVNRVSAYSLEGEFMFEYSINNSELSFSRLKAYSSLLYKTAIVVPIYNAYEDVLNCINRLESFTPVGVEVLLINDASTDRKIFTLLDNLSSDKLNFKVIHNSENLGFTKTVNKGINLCSDKNVIILNSDARVTPRWFEGMTHAASTSDDIATVTAMSDRAGAFSAPNIGNDNVLPEGVSEESYAVAFRRYSMGIYPTVPTGNGFCMFIQRKCLNEIGALDVEAFPRGYGEENDFCMRARKNGWRNIIDDRTYVFHDRSKSFGGEKSELIKVGRKVIDERYPDYSKAIQFYSKSYSMHLIRYRARIAMNSVVKTDFRPRVMYVVSTQTGGTPQTNRDLMMSLYDTVEPWLLHCNAQVMTLYKIGAEEDEVIEQHHLSEIVEPYTHKSSEYDRVIKDWLFRYDFTMAHIRHLVWHSLNLPKIIKESGAKVVMSFHDYYVASPSVKLIDPYNDPNSTSHKLAPLWTDYDTPDSREKWNKQWRSMFADSLNYCDGFVTTSDSAKDIILKYVDLNSSIPFVVINHGRDFEKFRNPNFNNFPSNIIKILVPGNIDKNKGLDIIHKLLELDSSDRLQIHILGNCSEVFPNDKVVNHGTYNREDFIDLVAKINPHITAIFSIWNETWCHTLTESWASGVPAIVFNFETLAARIQTTKAGWIANPDNIENLYHNIVDVYTKNDEYLEKLNNVKQWQSGLGAFNTNGYMSIQYLNLYKNILNNIDKPLNEFCGVLVPSNRKLTTGNGSSHVRVWQKTENSLNRSVSYLRLRPDQLLAGVQARKIDKAIIQRNVLNKSDWNKLKPSVLNGSFNYIFEIDDDLLNVPADKDPKSLYKDYKETLQELLDYAHLVMVSTQYLKNKYEKYNSNIKVIPNQLNQRYWLNIDFNKLKKSKDSSSFLYFGSYTHLEDLETIMPALDKVYKENNDFKLKLIGVTNNLINKPWIEQIDIPLECKEYPEFIRFLQENCQDCIAGLAPLKDNEFNKYKSDLKVKEYIGLGLHVIAQNSQTYRDFSENSYVNLVSDYEWYNIITNMMNSHHQVDTVKIDPKIIFNEKVFDELFE